MYFSVRPDGRAGQEVRGAQSAQSAERSPDWRSSSSSATSHSLRLRRLSDRSQREACQPRLTQEMFPISRRWQGIARQDNDK